jgi:hypothetical protein
MTAPDTGIVFGTVAAALENCQQITLSQEIAVLLFQFSMVIDKKRKVIVENTMRCHLVYMCRRKPNAHVPAQDLKGCLALDERALVKRRKNVFRLNRRNHFWKQVRRNDLYFSQRTHFGCSLQYR